MVQYRIEYGCGISEHRKRKKVRMNAKPALLIVAALAFAALMVWPAGRLWVRDLLLPGDEAVTAAALGKLVSDLMAGEQVGASIESFCLEIIAGG